MGGMGEYIYQNKEGDMGIGIYRNQNENEVWERVITEPLPNNGGHKYNKRKCPHPDPEFMENITSTTNTRVKEIMKIAAKLENKQRDWERDKNTLGVKSSREKELAKTVQEEQTRALRKLEREQQIELLRERESESKRQCVPVMFDHQNSPSTDRGGGQRVNTTGDARGWWGATPNTRRGANRSMSTGKVEDRLVNKYRDYKKQHQVRREQNEIEEASTLKQVPGMDLKSKLICIYIYIYIYS